jgi:hypothetical protein
VTLPITVIALRAIRTTRRARELCNGFVLRATRPRPSSADLLSPSRVTPRRRRARSMAARQYGAFLGSVDRPCRSLHRQAVRAAPGKIRVGAAGRCARRNASGAALY